jgi:L-aminopeptidase/D-esterase-like protein
MLNELFSATVEATEEAVLNALWAAPEVTGRE